MALGAAGSDVRWMILRQSLVLVLWGLALGVAMMGVSIAAACLPARRASRVDPLVALRTE